jgi:heterodisulfide reductase subunit A
VRYIKGKVGKISENKENNTLVLKYEDINRGILREEEFELVVLAVGAEPSMTKFPMPLDIADDNFIAVEDIHEDPVSTNIDGIFVAGVSESPKDIPDSVVQAGAAAMKASIILGGD